MIYLTVSCLVNLSLQTSLQLGSILLKGLGVMSDDVSFFSKLVRDSMELQAQEALKTVGKQKVDIMKPLEVLQIVRQSVVCNNINRQYLI